MKAIVSKKSGGPEVLQYTEVDKPLPGEHEILVKIRASTVTRGDVFLRKMPRLLLFFVGLLFGFKAKNIPGTEFAGEVETAGSRVQGFAAGDRVFGTTTGLTAGGNAEYACVPEKWKLGVVAKMPLGLSFEEAAAVPVGAMTALYLLKKADVREGKKVLVYGASGSVGTYGVQIARAFGAEVTGVCSTKNVELVQSLGAATVIDYTQGDFTRNDDTYDVIFDAVGRISKSHCRHLLSDRGTYLTVKSPTDEDTDNLNYIIKLIEAGEIRPVIDMRFPLERVAEAHRYVEAGHKRGNVVITV